MTIVRNILIGLVVLIVVLVFARNVIIRAGAEQAIRSATGLQLKIGGLDIGVFKPEISIKDLKIYNPEGSPDPVMIDVPEVYVKYNLSEMLKGVIALHEVRFGLKELIVVRAADKTLNLDKLKALQPPKGDGPPPKFSIDDLVLAIGKVTYKDYTQTPALVRDFELNINEHYTNIKSAEDLVRLIVVSALQRTTIANLAQFNLSQLKQTLSSTVLDTLQSQGAPIKNLLKKIQF